MKMRVTAGALLAVLTAAVAVSLTAAPARADFNHDILCNFRGLCWRQGASGYVYGAVPRFSRGEEMNVSGARVCAGFTSARVQGNCPFPAGSGLNARFARQGARVVTLANNASRWTYCATSRYHIHICGFTQPGYLWVQVGSASNGQYSWLVSVADSRAGRPAYACSSGTADQQLYLSSAANNTYCSWTRGSNPRGSRQG